MALLCYYRDRGATLKVVVVVVVVGGGGVTSNSEWEAENHFFSVTLYNFQKALSTDPVLDL